MQKANYKPSKLINSIPLLLRIYLYLMLFFFPIFVLINIHNTKTGGISIKLPISYELNSTQYSFKQNEIKWEYVKLGKNSGELVFLNQNPKLTIKMLLIKFLTKYLLDIWTILLLIKFFKDWSNGFLFKKDNVLRVRIIAGLVCFWGIYQAYLFDFTTRFVANHLNISEITIQPGLKFHDEYFIIAIIFYLLSEILNVGIKSEWAKE
jgi:hypothetical protein